MNQNDIIKTDTQNTDSSVSEPYISQVPDNGSPSHSEKVYRAGRLYQFSTRENGNNEMIFGNIFELSYQAESHDLDAIRDKLKKEIANYNKIMYNESEQGKLVLSKAIDNIMNMYIWKLEQYTDGKVSYIRKIKLCKAEDLINAKKS